MIDYDHTPAQTTDAMIVALYDETVAALAAATGDPDVKFADTRAAMLPGVREILEAEERDLDREATYRLDRVITPERERRSRSLKRNIELILDAIRNPDQGAFIEPWLDQPYLTGDQRGVDRILRHWRAADLQGVAFARYRNAANVMAEAREFDDRVRDLVSAMQAQGAIEIGDLIRPSTAAT